MNRMMVRVLIACAVLAVFVGCRTGTIYNVVDSPVMTASGKEPTLGEVRKAIVEAGVGLNWTMAESKPGNIIGTLNVRSHQAVVDIKYNTKKYSIMYKSSMNLKYDADNQSIHSNYNGWVQNLDNAIRARLSAAAS